MPKWWIMGQEEEPNFDWDVEEVYQNVVSSDLLIPLTKSACTTDLESIRKQDYCWEDSITVGKTALLSVKDSIAVRRTGSNIIGQQDLVEHYVILVRMDVNLCCRKDEGMDTAHLVVELLIRDGLR
ncbi:hypothetical protein ACLOJK_039244 [Asimina triloba]